MHKSPQLIQLLAAFTFSSKTMSKSVCLTICLHTKKKILLFFPPIPSLIYTMWTESFLSIMKVKKQSNSVVSSPSSVQSFSCIKINILPYCGKAHTLVWLKLTCKNPEPVEALPWLIVNPITNHSARVYIQKRKHFNLEKFSLKYDLFQWPLSDQVSCVSITFLSTKTFWSFNQI